MKKADGNSTEKENNCTPHVDLMLYVVYVPAGGGVTFYPIEFLCHVPCGEGSLLCLASNKHRALAITYIIHNYSILSKAEPALQFIY